jgi:hypothetical protein
MPAAALSVALSDTSFAPAPPGAGPDAIAYALGRDYARHRLPPPLAEAHRPAALRRGLIDGQPPADARARAATPVVRAWLELRLGAWQRDEAVDDLLMTPALLRRLGAGHCPITRVALGGVGAGGHVVRARIDAAWTAGNLVVVSGAAARALGAHDEAGARRCARLALERDAAGSGPNPRLAGAAGLGAAQWLRAATLRSFVTPLPHWEAAARPLHLLPPPRLRLFNPVQALQAMLSLQLLQPGWSQRYARLEALLPGALLRHDFRGFVMALLPRVLEAGMPAHVAASRWAVEDAWSDPLVLRRWLAFARALDADRSEDLLRRAAARRLATTRIGCLDADDAVDGWALDTHGDARRAGADVAAAPAGDARVTTAPSLEPA